MLVITLSRLSLLPHLKVPDLIMTAHMTRRGCDVSYSTLVCPVGDSRSSGKRLGELKDNEIGLRWRCH